MYLIQEQTVGSISRVTGGFWSVSELKCIPRLLKSSTIAIRMLKLRARRSSLHAMRVSPSCNLRQTYETCKPLMSCAPRFVSKLTVCGTHGLAGGPERDDRSTDSISLRIGNGSGRR